MYNDFVSSYSPSNFFCLSLRHVSLFHFCFSVSWLPSLPLEPLVPLSQRCWVDFVCHMSKLCFFIGHKMWFQFILNLLHLHKNKKLENCLQFVTQILTFAYARCVFFPMSEIPLSLVGFKTRCIGHSGVAAFIFESIWAVWGAFNYRTQLLFTGIYIADGEVKLVAVMGRIWCLSSFLPEMHDMS